MQDSDVKLLQNALRGPASSFETTNYGRRTLVKAFGRWFWSRQLSDYPVIIAERMILRQDE
jgi:hypothetical protein